MEVRLIEEKWWLMTSSLPNLNWARLRIYKSGKLEIFDMDGKTHKFTSKSNAINWLLEDEYTEFDKLDTQDEKEYGIIKSSIIPPSAVNANNFQGLMYVKAKMHSK